MQKWTLITGASSGIGLALAEKFAQGGHNLILVGRDPTALEKVAKNCRDQYGVQAQIRIADLAKDGAGSFLAKELERDNLEIECLVNNAGFGVLGAFHETSQELESDMLKVNLISLVELTKSINRNMVMRKSGRILNVASTAAFQPGPYMAVYYASKAFVHSFSLALSEENRKKNVTVTVLCPGLTKTKFLARAGIAKPTRLERFAMDAESVAKVGYRATMRGDAIAIPGLGNRLIAFGVKFFPMSWVLAFLGRVQKSLN